MDAHNKSLVQMIDRLNDFQNTIASFINRLEEGDMTWSQIIERYVSIITVMASVLRVVSNLGVTLLNSNVMVPTQISSDTDPKIHALTAGRLSSINHETMPILLRTRYNPSVEAAVESAKYPDYLPPGAGDEAAIVEMNSRVDRALQTLSYQDSLFEARQVPTVKDEAVREFPSKSVSALMRLAG